MNRRQYLQTALGALASVPLRGADTRPNIVVIVSDDHGYADSSRYDHPDEVNTPNIDRIAKRGVRFTQGYANCYVCAPTRAAVLTGRYPQRYGFYTAADSRTGLPTGEITLADALHKAGYATGAFGKWHLGLEPDYHPLKRGFDEFYGFLGHGAHDYFNLKRTGSDTSIWRNNQVIDDTGYLTDNLAREAVSFIERHRDRRFFLYLPFNAVHFPMQAPEADVRKHDTGKHDRDIYLGMLDRMDVAIGAVLDTLDKHGLTGNTLLFFFSDNGGAKVSSANNGALRDFKHSVYEGGIRVPFLMSWPSRLPRNAVNREPVMTMDVFPTVCEAIGVDLPGGRVYDGKSLLPVALGKQSGPLHDRMFWDADEPKQAIRHGRWKLVHNEDRFELYDLENDFMEKRDLAASEPATVARLKNEFEAWRKEMAPRIKRKREKTGG